MRTPLNAVIGYADLLVEDVGSVKPEELTQDLQRIKSSGEHLLGLINQLLDFSRLESGNFPLTIESFKVEGLVRELVQTMEKEALKNENTLIFVDATEAENPAPFATDATKLRQCLYNLVANACKFTSKGEIQVSLSRRAVGSGSAGGIVIEVEDDGIGMTAEQLERVFEPFVQAEESIARRFGGTGLGLSLSRRLAEAIGGSLEAYSQEGRGSTFVLIVPNLIELDDEKLLSSP